MSKRFSRQILLSEVGDVGQAKIQAARVVVIGAGGLGCPVLTYLAAAGVGTIGIVDDDVVDESNLHRQVLYAASDVGYKKVDVAARRLQAMAPDLIVLRHTVRVSASNILPLLSEYDIVVDGTDNFAAKYLANDACYKLGKPLVYASISQFEGQLAVFNVTRGKERTPNYRDLFPSPPPAHLAPNCQEAGVLGVLPGIMGCLQATEVLKLILDVGDCLAGKLLCVDALTMDFRRFDLSRRADNPLYVGVPSDASVVEIEDPATCAAPGDRIDQVSRGTYLGWRHDDRSMLTVDVRNAHERQRVIDGAIHIPLSELPFKLGLLEGASKIVFYCQSGIRSQTAARLVQSGLPEVAVFSLEGGVNKFSQEAGDATV
ncbi:ThiF family adenylyltransferase [Burkholderia ubonensis]|uniref:ThiF family adenylyltransferase n=1 Tax=Burkholderia ubonensis TaxID=101571 RepID=UPI0009B35C2A|nr:ThiF family adenylyltransferase [Burkholderia ubonensis]